MRTLITIVSLLSLIGCGRQADVVSENLSKSADSFEIRRRVVFYNGITGTNILTITGLCSLGNNDTSKRMSVVCKVGPESYVKHFLGLSDNVTFIAEQVEASGTNKYQYLVNFNPSAIIPEFQYKK